ncbi:MAG TPA: hypothetical protein VI457_02090 [Methylococcaceae bacterium]|nr:hypothetical protein [Methylococcaceae bacterium]
MADSTRPNDVDVHDLLALLQHWFACFQQCVDAPVFHPRAANALDTESQWKQLLQLSGVIEKKLFLFRGCLAASEPMETSVFPGESGTRGGDHARP